MPPPDTSYLSWNYTLSKLLPVCEVAAAEAAAETAEAAKAAAQAQPLH